jgi:hypothetical protein
MRLFHPPLRLSILYGSRDQLRPGSFLHKRKEPGNEVAIATVCVLALWQVSPNYACIVSSNDGLHIVHATITDLNCVSVKKFVKFVVRWKMFVNASYVGFDTLTERWVKPRCCVHEGGVSFMYTAKNAEPVAQQD